MRHEILYVSESEHDDNRAQRRIEKMFLSLATFLMSADLCLKGN